MDDKLKKVEDDIPSSYLNKFNQISQESWKHEDFRKKVIEICKENHDTSDFIKKIESMFDESIKKETFIDKVKLISSKEIKDYVDKSRIKTVFWIIGLILTTIIGVCAEKFGKIF